MKDPISLTDGIIILSILSFALETVVAGLLSVVAASPLATDALRLDADGGKPGPEYKAFHFTFALVLAILLCFVGEIGVFAKLENFGKIIDAAVLVPMDKLLTALLLVAGTDRIAALKKQLGAAKNGATPPDEAIAAPETQPIQITGTLKLDDGLFGNAKPGNGKSAEDNAPGSEEVGREVGLGERRGTGESEEG